MTLPQRSGVSWWWVLAGKQPEGTHHLSSLGHVIGITRVLCEHRRSSAPERTERWLDSL